MKTSTPNSQGRSGISTIPKTVQSSIYSGEQYDWLHYDSGDDPFESLDGFFQNAKSQKNHSYSPGANHDGEASCYETLSRG